MIIRVKAFVSEFGTMGSMVRIRSAKCNYPWSRFELGWVTACWKKYIYVRFSLFWVLLSSFGFRNTLKIELNNIKRYL